MNSLIIPYNLIINLYSIVLEPSKLKIEHFVVKQRLLALEDGLFYAGYIKEIQASDRFVLSNIKC